MLRLTVADTPAEFRARGRGPIPGATASRVAPPPPPGQGNRLNRGTLYSTYGNEAAHLRRVSTRHGERHEKPLPRWGEGLSGSDTNLVQVGAQALGARLRAQLRQRAV